MLKCCSLYSGSSGNSFFIQSDNSNILVDVGVSIKKIQSALNEKFNLSLDNIDAIFITHEHVDHTKSLFQIASKYDMPIFATFGTWHALELQNKPINNKNTFILNKSFNFKDLRIYPFPTPHDAEEPCGFNIYNHNSKISIATDIGYIDENLFNHLKESSFIMLESNYEPQMLKFSTYPYILKRRISGNLGHLSNDDAGNTISKLISYGLKDALLIHLSKENNMPEIAYQNVMEKLNSCNQNTENFHLSIAPRNNPSVIFDIKN